MNGQKVTACFASGILCFALVLAASARTADRQTLALWPKGVPGEKATEQPERDMTTASDAQVAGRPLIRLGNVTVPTMTVYEAPEQQRNGAGVIVFPGGGYHILAMDLEGTEVCEWLNSIGVTAFLVKYRVPEPADLPRYAEPLQDAGRAISLVREHAADWHVRPDRIGVLGFSAGGHLAALLSNSSGDQGSLLPNFTLLVYPAYLSVKDEGREIAPEIRVTAKTPPAFIVQAEDDKNFVGGTILYYETLRQAKVPAEMHLFAQGGHGYGLRKTGHPIAEWPQLAEAWMRASGWLTGP